MTDTVDVFLAYAHDDEALLKELLNQLAVLQRRGILHVWHDRQISAGAEWRGQSSKSFPALPHHPDN